VPPPPKIGDGTSNQLNEQVATAALTMVGNNVVGPKGEDYSKKPKDAECFYLVDFLLRDAGAKSAADIMGVKKVTAKADYEWSHKDIDLKDVKPGDVLQFKDHKIIIETNTKTKRTYPDGHSTIEEGERPTPETLPRGHHTAVVLKNNGDGTMDVAEQHVVDHNTNNETTTVRRNKVYTQSVPATTRPKKTRFEGDVKVEETTTVTITVTGKISAYRPEAKDWK
jgi:hypothetical protein